MSGLLQLAGSSSMRQDRLARRLPATGSVALRPWRSERLIARLAFRLQGYEVRAAVHRCRAAVVEYAHIGPDRCFLRLPRPQKRRGSANPGLSARRLTW